MNNTMLKMYIRLQAWMQNEDGQDLVEYALVVGLIALGATAAMSTLAGTIGTAFGHIGTSLTTNVP